MLGSDVVAALARRGHEVRPYDLPECDITDAARVREALAGAEAAINCAAYTDVDGAEEHYELAHRINGRAVGQLGALAREQGVWLVHFSTDFVFDGHLKRPYVEDDRPHPINEYGHSKLAGERLLAESRCAHCLVRLEWSYGTHGENFVSKLIRRARAGQPFKVVDDQVGAPTATTEIAEMVCTLLEKRPEGVFHYAGAGYVSRFGMAQFVLDRLSLDTRLEPCSSAEYAMPATRPLNSRFDCGKIQALLDGTIKPWQEPLESFLRRS
jgi:dTDP-4-dehydrorhamnose reductase